MAWWDQGNGVVWQIPVGSVSDVATAVAAIVALYLAYRAGKAAHEASRASIELLGLEQQREDRADALARERRDQDARGAQADSIAAWISDESAIETLNGARLPDWRIVLSNRSALPVYSVRVHVVGPADPRYVRHTEFRPVLPPGTTSLTMPDVDLLPMTFPGPDGEGIDVEEGVGDLSVAVDFRDTAGRTWRRDEDGVLTLKRSHFLR